MDSSDAPPRVINNRKVMRVTDQFHAQGQRAHARLTSGELHALHSRRSHLINVAAGDAEIQSPEWP
jgi:hypothetical protein